MSQWVSPSPLQAKPVAAHHCKATTAPVISPRRCHSSRLDPRAGGEAHCWLPVTAYPFVLMRNDSLYCPLSVSDANPHHSSSSFKEPLAPCSIFLSTPRPAIVLSSFNLSSFHTSHHHHIWFPVSETFCIASPLLSPSLSTLAWFYFLPPKSLPSWVPLANPDSMTHHISHCLTDILTLLSWLQEYS